MSLIETARALKRGDYGAWEDDWLIDQFAAAADRIEALEAALKPFAQIAPSVEHTDHRDGDVVHRQRTPSGYAELTKADFRRALAALPSSDLEKDL